MSCIHQNDHQLPHRHTVLETPGKGTLAYLYQVSHVKKTELNYICCCHELCTCHRLPRGGGPRADVGEYGDFMGTLQQISALVVGEMWGLRFLNALLSGNMWGLHFCSTERRLGTSKENVGQDDIEHLAKMCFLSLEDAEARAEHHMSICQRRRQVQQKRQRKTTRKQDGKNCQVDGQEESVYCICRRGEDQGFMIHCSNCNKWFHGECVRVSKQDADQIEDLLVCHLFSSLRTQMYFRLSRFSPPKNNVCVSERQNDFRDVEILSQSPFSS